MGGALLVGLDPALEAAIRAGAGVHPVRSIPTARGMDVGGPFDVAVVGETDDGPLAEAQALDRAARGSAVVLVCPPAHLAELEAALRYTPLQTVAVRCLPRGDPDAVVVATREAEASSRRRRQHADTLRTLNGVLGVPEHTRRRRADALLDHVGVGLLHLDARGCVQSANAYATRLLGAPEAEVIGHPWRVCLGPGAPAEVAEGGESTVELVARDGTRRHLSVGLAPLSEDDASALVFVQDISERKRLEAELRRAEALATTGRLAARVGHDINNPLTWVLDTLEWLQGELAGSAGLAPPVHRRLAEALDGARRIREIVRSLRPAELAPPLPPAEPPRGRPRVLVVDDEPLLCEVVARLLERDHEVTVAGSAAEALAMVEAGRFDAILSDYMMPGMNGGELYGVLTKTAPDLAARMVFMTGGACTREADAFFATVRPPTIFKPFRAAELRAKLATVLAAPPL